MVGDVVPTVSSSLFKLQTLRLNEFQHLKGDESKERCTVCVPIQEQCWKADCVLAGESPVSSVRV